MRILSATIIMAVILVSSAFCQVDTLMLVEINSIEVSGEITHLYTESIRDDIQEIFICTQDHIYVYDSQTNELIWSRGELINPEDLLFEDINNDGFKDLAFRDSLNIFLYDVINSDLIWTSPELDSTYKCYTIGDRNDDGWIDVAVVTKELFTRPDDWENYDTVWVDLLDGPNFDLQNEIIVLMHNYSENWPDHHGTHGEIPSKIIIEKITNMNQLQSAIFLFSTIRCHWYGMGGSWGSDGNIWVFNGSNLDTNYIAETGYTITYIFDKCINNQNDSTYLCTINGIDNGSLSESYFARYINYYTWNSMVSYWLWNGNDEFPGGYFAGALLGDVNVDFPGIELFYAADFHYYLYNIQTRNYIWINSDGPFEGSSSNIYKNNDLSEYPQILARTLSYGGPIEYDLIQSLDGNVSAILPNPGFIISHVSDLNSDGNDELLSIQGNELHIYHLDYFVDVDQPETLPYHTFIQPNYPNPFNNSTTLEYGLKKDERVVIEIYDLLGRKVETLVDAYQPAGMHSVIWNAAHISTGIYFYKINAGDFSKTRKMLLLR